MRSGTVSGGYGEEEGKEVARMRVSKKTRGVVKK